MRWLIAKRAAPIVIGLLVLVAAVPAGPPATAQGPLPPPSGLTRPVDPEPPQPPPTPTSPPKAPGPLRPLVSRSIQNDVSLPLRSIEPIPPSPGPTVREIPRLPLPRGGPARGAESLEGPVRDPVLQSLPGRANMPSPIQSFEGVNNVDNKLPPDTNGDVGPNHYVQWVNVSFAIWNKSGTLLYGPAAGKTLWSGFGGACQTQNDGDPIVLYDPLADRWLMSQFALPNSPSGPFYQCIAVSQTPDPTGAWHRYAFLVHDTKMNDYPKFGVWPDGYYMSVNQFDGSPLTYAGAGVFVFDRANILAGNPATFQYFDLNSVNPNFGGMLPSDLDGARPPPAGSPNYFVEVDDSSWIAPSDALRLWEFHVDWTAPANSTFGLSGQPNAVLNTASWAPLPCVGVTLDCIPQPGVSTSAYLDAIGNQIMYRLAYRNFGDHESLVVNHTVDAGSGKAGIRWYEIRDPGGSPTIYQQGTYAPDASHRWMGSMAMDGNGNMALGYSVSSSTVYPSIRYTGWLTSDPLGAMPQGEETLMAGGGSQTSTMSRWGDYSMMAVDPADDCTFWYTQEYYQNTSSSGWRTRIGSFKFPSCASSPNLAASAKRVSSASASPGGVLTYTLALTNTGTMNATARLTDTLPITLTYNPGSATGGATYVTATNSITWTGVVTAGSALSLTYRAAITSPLDNGTAFTNTATIYDGVNAPFETAPVTTTVSSSPNLSTSAKAVSSPNASPGATITYTLTLSNMGSMNAYSARLTDTLPISVTYVSGSATGGATYVNATNSITWTGVVTAGSALSLTYSAAITSPLDNGTAITNTATIYDGVNAPFETAPVTTTISSSPNLSTSAKRVSSAIASPGGVLTYTVTLTNTGNMNAYSARLTDTLPISVTYVSGSATGGATYVTATNSITWTGVVTAGSALSLTYTAVITSPLDNGALITNTATIYDGVNAPFDTAPVTTTISSSPNLSTSAKRVSSANASPGATITYTITLTNTGNMNASARLTDTLPITLTYLPGSATGGVTYDTGSRSITWTGVVTAGNAVPLTYSAVIAASLTTVSTITNTAIIYDEVALVFETRPVTTTVVPSIWRLYAPYLARNNATGW